MVLYHWALKATASTERPAWPVLIGLADGLQHGGVDDLRVLLGPVRPGREHGVGAAGEGQDPALAVEEHSLRRRRPDVHRQHDPAFSHPSVLAVSVSPHGQRYQSVPRAAQKGPDARRHPPPDQSRVRGVLEVRRSECPSKRGTRRTLGPQMGRFQQPTSDGSKTALGSASKAAWISAVSFSFSPRSGAFMSSGNCRPRSRMISL